MGGVREVQQPSWLNKSFFEDIYRDRKDLPTGCRLRIVSCKGVVDIGDNYASTMYRVGVACESDGDDRPTAVLTNYIVKAILADNPMMKEFGVFANEFEAYRTAVKGFAEIWSDRGEPVQFGPKCFKIVDDDNEVIVLSDLQEEGYRMQNRFEGLDLEHAKITLQKLAQWHAASIYYKEKNGNFGPRLSRKMFDPNRFKFMSDMLFTKISALSKAVQVWGLGARLSEKILNWKLYLQQEMMVITDPGSNPADFQVLCHGDLWLNNQMFKYDDNGRVQDVILLDYQLTYWGRPVTDILYFLLSSVKTEVLIENYDALFKFYHDVLRQSAATLGITSPMPTLRDFNLQILKYGFYTSICCLMIIPIVLMEKTDDANIENLLNDALNEKQFAGNPRMEKKMRLLLPFLEMKGMLDSDLSVEIGATNGH